MTGLSKKGQRGFQPKEVKDRQREAGKEHGYTIKNELDYIEEMNNVLEKHHLRKSNEKIDQFGLSKDFYQFMGIPQDGGRNYRIDLRESIKEKLQEDFANYYTPLDDFYGSGGGSDTVYNMGRIPVSHLMVLCSQRLGVAFRGCNSVANDVFRNKFEFVNYDKPDKVVERPEILKWMRKTFFWSDMVNTLDFERRTGLGHLISHWDHEDGTKKIDTKAPNKRPDSFETFSCYYMTPNNVYSSAKLDYDKKKWDFTGGVVGHSNIHHSRVYVLETRRVEGGLRGIAIPELCWVPLMCYLNTCYYILRSLSQLGTVIVGVNVAQEYPSPELADKYLAVLKKMQANKFYIFGKNTNFKIESAASKIGEGLNSYLEFLKEDISSAWIIPKNQLFGRSDGGGMSGMGSLVSKEDYLSSNLSTLQLNLTDDIMYILQEHCHFPKMENLTIRWNLDLHKTEQQRLTEDLMREQLEQAKTQTKMITLQAKMMKIQHQQAELQWKEFQKEPSLLLPQAQEQAPKAEKKVNEDEEIKPKPTKKDFIPSNELYKRWKFRIDTLNSLGQNLNNINNNWSKNITTIDERIKKSSKK